MTLVANTAALADFCERQRSSSFVTVDTEFLRDSTYWPKLCLVQLGGPGEAIAIDTLAERIDLAPLLALMADSKVLKVFHSGRQDLEIFYHLMDGKLPEPIFDTQVAAMVCGFGESVSYEKLARQLIGVRIDKASRFADWSQRPLTERQLAYALADVIHLRPIYERLNEQLEASGRAQWLAEEMDVLTARETYEMDPQSAWHRLKIRSNDRRTLAVAQTLAAWRESEAQRRDLPRNRVLRDEQLIDVAVHAPRDAKTLSRTRGLSKEFSGGRMGQAILAAVEKGLATPEDERPPVPLRRELPQGLTPLVELLKVLLKTRCAEHGVAQKLVASVPDLEAIATEDEAEVPALQGWRREIYGVDAMALKRGELALTANAKGVKVINLKKEAAVKSRPRKAAAAKTADKSAVQAD
jgi:ribonuclease D